MSETGCGFQRAEDRHDPEWFCVVHLCWSSTTDLCPLQRAEAAIQRVLGLHHFVVDEIETREGPEDVQHCSECGYIPTDEEPCPTLAALNTATWLRSLTDGGVA